MSDEPILLTSNEAAAKLGLPSADRIRYLARKKLIPHRREGRYVKFTHQDLEDYAESIKVPATDMRRSNPRNRK